MGIKFKDIAPKQEITINSLKDKILAVDAYNIMYQFLTTIRSVDGTVLTDSNGNVTSHLIGLFNRTTSLMEQGLKLVFVFDGKPPAIKQKTWEKRAAIKKEAQKKLEIAKEENDLKSMRKFAARTAKLTKEMIEDAKNLLTLLGIPLVQAPSEGEAQATYMVKQGNAYAAVSQDYDTLLFGCPTLVRNLSIAGKRKKSSQFSYTTVKPEIVQLQEVLDNVKLNQDQLIVLAILMGTDYNPGGIKGIGPKKGLKIVQQHEDFESLFQEVKWTETYPELKWQVVFDTIKNMEVSDDYNLEWKKVDETKLIELLVEKHDFDEARVRAKLEKLHKQQKQLSQKGLGAFF